MAKEAEAGLVTNNDGEIGSKFVMKIRNLRFKRGIMVSRLAEMKEGDHEIPEEPRKESPPDPRRFAESR